MDADKFTPIYTCDITEECGPSAFNHANDQVYLVTNKGVNLVGLSLLDPVTGVVTPVETDPLKRVDLAGPRFSDLTETLVATVYADDKRRIYWKDHRLHEADYKWLRSRFPGEDVNFGSCTRDEIVALS